MRRSLRDLIGWLVVSVALAAALLPLGYPPATLAAVLGAILSARVVEFAVESSDLDPAIASAYPGAVLLAVALGIAYDASASPYLAVASALASGWILNDAVARYRGERAGEHGAAAL